MGSDPICRKWIRPHLGCDVTFLLLGAYKQVTDTKSEDKQMRFIRNLVLFFVFLAPVAALSALRPGDLPETSKWYFHVDFKEMRSSDAGKHLYAWLQEEVFEDDED